MKILDYEVYASRGFCYYTRIKNTVVLVQSPDNTGISITNASEKIAQKICNEFDIAPDHLVLFEVYINDCEKGERYSPSKVVFESWEDCDQNNCGQDYEGPVFEGYGIKQLDEEEFEQIISARGIPNIRKDILELKRSYDLL